MVERKASWTRSEIWIKEALGLPTYLAGTLAFLKVTRGDSSILVIVGLLVLITAYNAFFEYLFPDHSLRWQWKKIAVLIVGQVLLGGLILLYAWEL